MHLKLYMETARLHGYIQFSRCAKQRRPGTKQKRTVELGVEVERGSGERRKDIKDLDSSREKNCPFWDSSKHV